MPKQETRVLDLVQMIECGELRLPEMQRRYVWTSTRVRDLLDSLYRGYPSGTILVWETDAEQQPRDLQVQQKPNAFATQKLLLDGQQRLTSLTAVLSGKPIEVRNRQRPIDIAFNLNHPEGPPIDLLEVEDDANGNEEGAEVDEGSDDDRGENVLQRLNGRVFAVASSQILNRPNWVSVSKVFASQNDWELVKDLVSSPNDPQFAVYLNRLNRLRVIKDYLYTMEILPRNLSYEEVAEIFVRVNSLGAKLKGSDLALAQITAKWPGSLTIFEDFSNTCEEQSNFYIDTGLLVRLLVVFATGQSRFRTVSTIPLAKLQSSWEKTKNGIDYAINFLKQNAGIEGMSLLASPYYLIPIAVYGDLKDYKLAPSDSSQMLQWLFAGGIKGHFSGSSESSLDADLRVLLDGGNFGDLVQMLEQRFGRINVEPRDLAGRGQRSFLFSLSYLALKYSNAVDWNTGLGLSLFHQGHSHLIEYHHIFPKSLLQKAGFDGADINEISNMAFISGKANRNISNKAPNIYFQEIVDSQGGDVLLKQAIPLGLEMREIGNFGKFLEYRRQRLADLINHFIDQSVKNGQVSSFDL